MNDFVLAKKQRIMFDRMNDINVTGYRINVTEIKAGGESVEYVLATIPNPVYPKPIKIRKSFEYNNELKFHLPTKNVYVDNNYRISVYVDNKKLADLFVIYDEEERVITIDYTGIQSWQQIDIEYFYDAIEYFHETENYCIYNIEPIVDYSRNTVGNHNMLV